MGRGYNTLTGELRGDALDAPVGQLLGGGGQSTKYRLLEVDDLTQLRQELNVSASASLDALSGSASAKAEYVYKSKFTRYSYFLAVHVTVVNAQMVIKAEKLTEAAKTTLATNPKGFLASYGDHFISAITTGGEFIGIVQIETKSEEERTEVKARLQGALGTFSAQGDFSKAIETVAKENKTTISIFRKGGGGPLPAGTALSAAALNFPQDVDPTTGKPVVYSLTTSDYAVVTNLPGAAQLPDLSAGRDKVAKLAQAADTAMMLQAEIAYVKAHQYEFAAFSVAEMDKKSTRVAARLAEIGASAKQVKKDPEMGVAIPTFDDLLPLPKRILTASPTMSVMVQAEINVSTRTKFEGAAKSWIGNGYQIDCLGARLEPPIPGLSVHYKVGYQEWNPGYNGQHYQECADGERCVCNSAAKTHRLNAVSMWLTGPLAEYYSISYQATGANLSGPGATGDSPIAKDGSEIGHQYGLLTRFRTWVTVK